MRVVVSIFCAVCMTIASAECFRVLQQASYRPQRGYFKIYLSWYFGVLVVTQVAAVLLDVYLEKYSLYLILSLFAAVALVLTLVKRKCPLKVTKRVLRMFVVELVTLALLCVFVNNSYFVWLLPLTTLLSWAICLPIDVLINRRYIRLAQKKLFASNVTVIAITGSYGKTSVKDMLSTLLEGSLTPYGSYNTPLGIAKFINGTDLDGYKYLVLEFGARKLHDIMQLCKLYKPTYGVVTGVCAQHLSTFKTIDNVIATKRELVECLPANGFCVLNQSDEFVASFTGSGVCKKYLSREGVEFSSSKVDFEGTQIAVKYGDDVREVKLPQISDYVVDTFAMCLQVALRLGQDFDKTLDLTVNVRQTPHRLELMRGVGCYILDDSYNASIVGVTSCCKTLKKFDCAKVVITQGLVECGRKRRKLNTLCGQLLGVTCDVAVVLGRNGKYLTEGLCMTNCKVLTARNLTQAVQLATPYAHGGILLFQNDLPD